MMKHTALALLALCVWVAPASAAIAFDASAAGALNNSISHTITGSDPVIVVGCFDDDGASNLMTAVKWNTTEDLTKIAEVRTAGGDRWVSLWYRLAPTTGAHTVTVTTTAAAYQCSVISLTGVSALDTSSTNTANTVHTVSTTFTVAANTWIVSVAKETLAVSSSWTNATQRQEGGGLHIADSGGPLSGAQTTTVDAGIDVRWGIVSASFTPTGGGGGGTPSRLLLLGVSN